MTEAPPDEPAASADERGPASLPAPAGPPLHLFQGYGVEIEHMIVDAGSLDPLPVADRLLEAAAGEPVSEVELDELAWSNELVLHVLELKTRGPAPSLVGLADVFQRHVARAEALLEPLGARLLPGGMHPWMDPGTRRLWPHEYDDVYRAFDRIFDCRGHGWANLQSVHLNLPFHGDEELARLHGAVRAVLPLIPALSAASPVRDGRMAGALDARLLAYRDNARRVPSVAGRVVPEAIRSRREYEERILEPIYRDLEPLDPEGVLRHEWVNGRGAIARFSRGAVEVRVVDTQECPAADLAVLGAVSAAVERLAGDASPEALHAPETERLADLLDRTAVVGERARVDDSALLGLLGLGPGAPTAGEVWMHLIGEVVSAREGWPEWRPALELILEAGPLARRIRTALDGGGPRRLREVYRRLADCLRTGSLFRP